jgi:hypothetical protein
MDIAKILDMIKNNEDVTLEKVMKNENNFDKVYINEGIINKNKL